MLGMLVNYFIRFVICVWFRNKSMVLVIKVSIFNM